MTTENAGTPIVGSVGAFVAFAGCLSLVEKVWLSSIRPGAKAHAPGGGAAVQSIRNPMDRGFDNRSGLYSGHGVAYDREAGMNKTFLCIYALHLSGRDTRPVGIYKEEHG